MFSVWLGSQSSFYADAKSHRKTRICKDNPMDYNHALRGKKIIVFGASRGIGFNIASHLLAKGCDVTISSGNAENLDGAFVAIQKTVPSASIAKIPVDFSACESLEAQLFPLVRQSEGFDAIIISSAVLGPSGDFMKTDMAEWIAPFTVNVFAPAALIHYFLKQNLIRKNGKIIILSGGISGPDPYFISFSATKHALNGFAYSLAHQLCKQGIWVNSILPGSYHTRMNETRIARGAESIGEDNFQLALSRIHEDEAAKYQKLHALVEFMCSSASNGIFGRLISAQYDDWKNQLDRLRHREDDLYKIIRIKD